MHKKLLTVAISAAISSMAVTAQADVKVYGRVQAEVAGLKNKITNVTKTDVIDNGGGTLGVSADEDLGSGMKGIGKVEYQINTAGDSCVPATTVTGGVTTVSTPSGQCTSDSSRKGDREMFVGLQGGFGTLRLGRVNSPYKLTGVALDPFVTTVLQARGNGGMSGNVSSPQILTPLNTHSSGYVNNGIVYNMPKFGGVGFDIYVSPDTQNHTSGDLSAALTWAGGPVSIFVVHNLDENANGNTATTATTTAASGNNTYDSKATKIGGQFKFGAAGSLALQLEQLETGIAGPGNETEFMFVGYQIPIGKFTPAIQVGLSTIDNAPDETETTYGALGVRYNFSKTFSTYGGYRMTKTETGSTTNIDQEAYTVGLRKDF